MALDTQADIARGTDWLAAADRDMARLLDITGPVRLRRREAGFPALVQIILGQQVSVASAEACWRRLVADGLTTMEAIREADDGALRACGFSRQKAGYVRAIAAADPDFEAMHALPDADLLAALMKLPGIGLWSAEIYAMFSLGRADIFAAGDLALKEAVRVLLDLPERPDEAALRDRAAAWSPFRTVAATALWQYYAVVKQREGLIP